MKIVGGSSAYVRGNVLVGGAHGKYRKLKSDVIVLRTGSDHNKAFEACVRVGRESAVSWRRKRQSMEASTGACGQGRNPRVALASALRKAANVLKGRRGAFAGYRRK